MNFLYKNFKRLMSWFPVALTILIITGCATVGPDYRPPETSEPRQWHTQLKSGLISEEKDSHTLTAWWTLFNDQGLSSLIERAVAGNLDLKKAWARIREERARRGVAKAGLFPTLDGNGSANWSRSSDNVDTDLYNGGFDAAWELDIFGGVRRSVEAADGDLQASQWDLRDVMVSLLAEVALNYVEVRTFQNRLDVAEANLAVQNDTYQLTEWQYQAGLSDELAVQEARYNLESTKSEIPTLRTGLEEAMNRIAVLLGDQPGRVHGELEKPATVPLTPLSIAVGVPADTLRRRPDVRRAERELAAQTARVGVATADFYPKITLNGSIGLEVLSQNNLPASPVRNISGGPQITWSIFQGGAILQNIKVQSALQEQALIKYEATILSALEEVENALTAYAEEQARRDALCEGEQAARKAAEMAQLKYEAGLIDFINVLIAQRSLLSFQDQLAQSNGTVTSNLVTLYKVLGGGWESLASNEKK